MLDEPFGALDAKVRKELRRWLRRLHEQMGLTSIFVTHDQEEALELADRVVVMDRGTIEQIGTPEDIYMRPGTPFVSDFVGETNSLPVTITGGQAYFLDRAVELAAGLALDGPARLHFRPHDVSICTDGRGCLPLLVTGIYRRGGEWRVEGDVAGTNRPVEVDIDANGHPPEIGKTLSLRINRGKVFHHAGA